jgi:UMF1 family MFS transporter
MDGVTGQATTLLSPGAGARERAGWYVYDWANSAFSTTVVTVFLGPYLTTITRAAADAGGFVYPLGLPVQAGAFFPYMVSLSVLLQVLCLPLFGAIADYSGRKRALLALATYLGALATAGLALVQGTAYLLGGLLFVIANLCFGAAIVFYNAFLPEIAGPDQRDAVSSTGWATGYLGGGLLLGLNLLFFSQAGALGLTPGETVRLSFLSAALWWGGFALITLATVRGRQPARPLPPGEHYLTVGLRQLLGTLRRARAYPQTLLFLVAYLLYNDGIETVISLSAQFGQEELGLSVGTLTSVILMVQFIAFAGALGFNAVARRAGARRTVMLTLVIWAGALAYAYAALRTTLDFYLLAAVIALVLGGSQALSRSLYSLMIPRGQEAEYFGLYEISDKGTSWLGPLLYGLALQFTGNYRAAILSIVVFFIAGLLLLARLDVRRAAREAGNEPPARG